MYSLNGDTDNKLGEVAHGREEIGVTGFGYGSARTPEVAMENKHRSGNGPAKKDFAVTANAFLGQNAVCAFADPVDNILAATRPKEAHPDAEQGFVNAEMATDGAAMEDIED